MSQDCTHEQYAQGMKRRVEAMAIESRFLDGSMDMTAARKAAARLIGHGNYICFPKDRTGMTVAYYAHVVLAVEGRRELLVQVQRLHGRRKGEVTLMPFSTGDLAFFGYVDLSDYRGVQFVRARPARAIMDRLKLPHGS